MRVHEGTAREAGADLSVVGSDGADGYTKGYMCYTHRTAHQKISFSLPF